MSAWFFGCVVGLIAMVPIHFVSVEHMKLQEKYGRVYGSKIGKIFGLISGWGFFIFWIGIWTSPQPRFVIPVFQGLLGSIVIAGLSIPIFNLVLCIALVGLGAWLAIEGVQATSLRVAETHIAERIVSSGVYSTIRHPQYFGGILAHVGISFLLSAWFSLLVTPLIIVLIYLISRKEEEELIREFGEEYENYSKKVPMFIPRLT